VTVTDYPDFQTPQAHADRIAVTGVPLLRLTTQLVNGAGVVLAGGASTQLLPSVSVNQPGYEIGIQAYMPASSGTLPFVHLALLWWDFATGLFGARRDMVITAGNAAANFQTYYVRGPMHSNMFRVDGINVDPAVAATLTFMVNQTSHVFEQDEARQYSYVGTAPNGFANPAGVPTTNLVAFANPTLAASASSSFLCALYSGDVVLNIDNSTSSAAVTINLQDAAGIASAHVLGNLFKTVVAAGATLSVPLTLPYTPLVLKVTNAATTGSVTANISITGQQH
jgi:hypothetical protein